MAFALPSQDVRALLRLLAELRDLGADPRAWRTHLTHNLERLCAAHVSVVTELHVNAPPPSGVTTNCTEAVTPLQMIDHGIDPSARSRFYNDLYFIDHTKDDALGGIVPLYGSSFTVTRGQVIDEALTSGQILRLAHVHQYAEVAYARHPLPQLVNRRYAGRVAR